MTTLRVLLALASSQSWFLHQLDVDNVFLHAKFDEEIYMDLPQGLSSTKSNQVCLLKKSLYGLKQASRQWYTTLCHALQALGFSQSSADHNLYIKKTFTGSFTTLFYMLMMFYWLAMTCLKLIMLRNLFMLNSASKTWVKLNSFWVLRLPDPKKGPC